MTSIAMVWQRNIISRYSSRWKHDRKYRRDVAVRASYVVLQQIDLLLTVLAVSHGLHELNPFMRSLLGNPLQLVLIKLVIPVCIACFIPGRLLIPAISLLSIVIIWNIKELLFLLF